MSEPEQKPRRWTQWSLMTMLLMMLLMAVTLLPLVQRHQQVAAWIRLSKVSGLDLNCWTQWKDQSGEKDLPPALADRLGLPDLLLKFDPEFYAYRTVDVVNVHGEISDEARIELVNQLRTGTRIRQMQWKGEINASTAYGFSCCRKLSRLRLVDCEDYQYLVPGIKNLEHLQVVEFVGGNFSAEVIQQMEGLSNVNLIILVNTNVESQQVEELQDALPDCYVVAFDREPKVSPPHIRY